MDWWSLFRKIRKVVFAFIALVSLIWAVVLSIYLSKEWSNFTILQRSIVLALICVNGVTSLLLYLMIVVVFRMWMELVRMIFLLAIHIGTAVPFTLFGAGMSCRIFDTQLTCKIVNLTFLATAWAISGLLLGYTVYLCIMSRVPRPFPLITPNDLLTGSTPSLSRSQSMSSVNSATRLLSRNQSLPTARPASPASIYSNHSTHSRTVPKKMFVANVGMATQSQVGTGQWRRDMQPRRGLSYGAMGMPTRPPPPTAQTPAMQSRFSGSTIASTRSLATPPPKAGPPVYSMGSLSRQASATASINSRLLEEKVAPRIPPRPLLLNPNPFMDPLSRHGTPETAMSAMSFNSAPANPNLGHMAPYNAFSRELGYGNYWTPYSASPASNGASVPLQLQAGGYSRDPSHLATTTPPDMADAYVNYARSPLGPPPRMHNATPSNASIHSITPSLHFTDEYGRAHTLPHPATAAPNPYMPQSLEVPPAGAHYRTFSDPVWRPYSAGARYIHSDVELPNPYNRGAEIRRYGSVPHVRAGSYGGNGYGAAVDEQGYGYYTAGYTGRVRAHERSGAVAADDSRWREMVMRAAAGQGVA